MKWIAIAGGWRTTNDQVRGDICGVIAEIFERGDGIVSGGALGVDQIGTAEMLRLNPSADRIKIFLPATLERYAAHYRKRAQEGVITSEQAEGLIALLEKLRDANPLSVVENTTNEVIGKEEYFNRITQIVDAADELVAFHINNTEGTQDTINKARVKSIPVRIFEYMT